MADLIERQVALDAFTGVVFLEPAQSAKKYIDGVIERIQNLPSVQPERPLKERDAALDTILKAVEKMKEMGCDEILVMPKNGMKAWDENGVEYTMMPAAQPERWIPCSERLPEGQVEVIVSCRDDAGDTLFDYTSVGFTTTDGEYWIVDNEINNYVVAWQPLPEPWKGEDHERSQRN